jgi:hypothetical protein
MPMLFFYRHDSNLAESINQSCLKSNSKGLSKRPAGGHSILGLETSEISAQRPLPLVTTL